MLKCIDRGPPTLIKPWWGTRRQNGNNSSFIHLILKETLMTTTKQTKLKTYMVVFLVDTDRKENSLYDELLTCLVKTTISSTAYAHDIVEYD